MKPDNADAAPAAWGKGPTTPAWPQDWWMPCPKLKTSCGTQMAQGLVRPASDRAAMATPPTRLKAAARRTVRTMPWRAIQRRQAKVPARYETEALARKRPYTALVLPSTSM